MAYGFYIDTDRCGSCKACVMACKDKNDLPVGMKFRKVIDYGGGAWEDVDGVAVPSDVFVYSVSVSCNHCENPACVAQCPTGAMAKDPETGIVVPDPEVCIGCGTCASVCPYNAPRIDSQLKISRKCDMCADYLAEGKNPACVDACLMRCLDFGDIEELRATYGDAAHIAPLADPAETSPNLVVGLSRHAGLEGQILSTEEELA